MMVEIVVERMYTQIFAKYVSAWIPMVVAEVILLQVDLRLQQVQQVNLLEVATQPGLLMDIVMISITTWTAVMMVETVADVTLTRSTAMYVDVLIQMKAGVTQRAHQLLRLHQLRQELVELEDAQALIIGLLMDIVMMTITTWTAVMMAETVADAMLTRSTALFVDVLIQMEVSVEQHAHKQQQAQQQA